ncbi:hypothetical protein A5653_01905 [Mycobacterium colombiense]|uniref:alpha/beta fold hydrolase n=1 Tax=Mycobacterium colombiense TaxID=339268 RepID=UPI0007EFC146|nr:alpha/beta hydrolase [Mycobacterium colombiense]OBK68935.1 hypothetical protein A5653_01905 [Mycobacterium colombiense]
MASQVGVVFIHGGLHTAQCWRQVLPLIAAPAIAPDLAGRGARRATLSELRTDELIRSVVEEIAAVRWPRVVLVAHSLGGISALGVCEALADRVAHVVFVSAVVPRPGTRPIDDLPGPLRWLAGSAMRRQIGRRDGRFVLPKWVARQMFCSDLSPSLSGELEAQWVPDTPWLAFDAAAQKPMPTQIGRTYLRLTADRALWPPLQDRMIRNAAPVEVMSEPSGHSIMVSRPQLCADIVNDIVARYS